MGRKAGKAIDLKKNGVFGFLKYFLYFVLFYIFFNAKIMGVYSPSFFGFFLSLAFLGENIYYLSLSYMASLVLHDASVFSIIFGLICCLTGGFISFLYKKSNKKASLWLLSLYTFLIGIIYVYFQFESIESVYISIVDVLLNIVFMLCCSNFFKVLSSRKFNLNLNVDEIVCGGVLLAIFFCGLQNVNIFAFDIVKLVGFMIVLFGGYMLPNGFNVVLGVVGGLGAFLCAGALEYVTLFSVVAVGNYIFKSLNRVYSVIVLLAIDVCLNLFLKLFGVVNIWTFMPTVTISIVYLIIPSKILKDASRNMFLYREDNTLKNILNQNKMQTSKKLLYTAEIFYEMDKSFRKLVKGHLDERSAKSMLCSEVIRENCENCNNKVKCLRGFNSELKKIFENLINAGFEKGKITLIDLPQYLTMRCVKLNQVVNSLNSLLQDYKNYAKINSDLDSSKLLIAEQLKGVSHILTELSKEANETVNLDHKFEKQIRESLIYNDIVPSEVVCFEKDEKTNVVSMILRTIDFDNDKIVKVLNSFCPSKMVLDEILPSIDSNLTYVSYKTAPTYDMAIGVAQMTKGGNDNSGDTHSMIKLSSGKYMMAICDGMGSGEKASKKSETSINLIENFYKAGYDDETILSCVNKLLNLTSENVFSALDVSVIDLKNGEVDFIKQGATVGYIKNGEEVSKIESNSLPLGILDEISPRVTKTVLTPDDFVVMMSDGIVDALGEENLEEYLKYMPSKSPQEVADCILNKAKLTQKNYPNDDMTVLVGKLYYNYA